MNKFDEARERFKPTAINLLFIAEAPPDEDRFFYFEHYVGHDNLFINMMGTLYPGLFNAKTNGQKVFLLNKFRDDGFFLIDAVNYVLPTEQSMSQAEKKRVKRLHIQENLDDLLDRVRKTILFDTPIVLISKIVFEIVKPTIVSEGYRVLNDELIPFPLMGKNPSRFKRSINGYVSSIGFSPHDICRPQTL